MNQKKIAFTIGSINTFGNISSFSFNKEALDVRSRNTDATVPKSGLFQEHRQVAKVQNALKKAKQSEMIRKKTKIIEKVVKPKQKQENKKKHPQSVVYKHFRRRIFLQNSLKNQKTSKDMVRILDWLMEASTALYLSRDSYFLAMSITRRLFSLNFLRNASEKNLESFVAAALSIAAKFDIGSINFPEAINKITDLRIDKDNIIQAQISIIKKLKFQIPLKSMVYHQIVDVCSEWHLFVISKADTMKIDISNLLFGEDEKIINWQSSSQKIFLQLCHLFNGIIIHCEEFQLQRGRVLKPLTFSLFTILNARTNQFFPLNPDDRSHLILLFQDFLKEVYHLNSEDIRKWMCELIKLRRHLNIVEFAQNFVRQALLKQQMSEDSESFQKKDFYYRQVYRSVLEWT